MGECQNRNEVKEKKRRARGIKDSDKLVIGRIVNIMKSFSNKEGLMRTKKKRKEASL